MVKVFGCVFIGRNQIGDFNYMIKQPEYKNSLFIFNDNIECFDKSSSCYCSAGGGNAVIRPYKCKSQPQAYGIPTGSLSTGGFLNLSSNNAKQFIDQAISEISTLLSKFKYDYIFYSSDSTGLLGHGIFAIGSDVVNYVTCQIHSLGVYSGIYTNISQLKTAKSVSFSMCNSIYSIPSSQSTKSSNNNKISPLPQTTTTPPPPNLKEKYYFIFGIIIFLFVLFWIIYFYFNS